MKEKTGQISKNNFLITRKLKTGHGSALLIVDAKMHYNAIMMQLVSFKNHDSWTLNTFFFFKIKYTSFLDQATLQHDRIMGGRDSQIFFL